MSTNRQSFNASLRAVDGQGTLRKYRLAGSASDLVSSFLGSHGTRATILGWGARVAFGLAESTNEESNAGRRFEDRDGEIDLNQFYELRAWSADASLHWLSDGGSSGRGTAIAEAPLLIPGSEEHQVEFVGQIHGLRYQLWGTAVAQEQASEVWSSLFESRIGHIEVPAKIRQGKRCVISSIEYVAKRQNGMAELVAERFIDLGESDVV